jgi:hypothetical protein
MHGGFVFGVAVIFIYTMTEALKYFTNKLKLPFPIGQALSEKPLLLFLSVSLLSIIFSYINPNTNSAVIFTMESHTSTKWLFTGIREYKSLLEDTKYPYGLKLSNISFWIILGITCILIALNLMRKKFIDITNIALVFFSSVAAITSVRYIPFFIAMAIPLTKDYRFFIKDTFFLQRLNKSLVTSIFFSLVLIFAIGFGLKDYKNMFTVKVHSFYPEKAIRFLLDNHIDANMFNSINKGSYLMWRLYPQYRVFQDTRYLSLEIVLEGIMIRNALHDFVQPAKLVLVRAMSGLVPEKLGKIKISVEDHFGESDNSKPLWKSLFKKYNIDLIVHEATADHTGEIFPLTLRLFKDDEWVLIYLDGSVQIFVRNKEKYSEIINKFKKPKELIYDEIILETARLVKRKTTFSTAYSSLAFALMMKGKEEDAKKMIDAALDLEKKDLVALFCNAYLALKEKSNKKP